MGTTKFPTAATGTIPLNVQFADEWERPTAAEEANIPMPLAAAGTSKIEQQKQTPQTLRRGAFERNSTSRKVGIFGNRHSAFLFLFVNLFSLNLYKFINF
jgi:hypothetical protein